MVNYAGYKAILPAILDNGEGRGIFYSARSDSLYLVISQNVYHVVFEYDQCTPTLIGSIDTITGDVFIDENLNEQIAFCDKKNVYIYDYGNITFQKLKPGYSIGYVAFQDNRFVLAVNNEPTWLITDGNLFSVSGGTPVVGGTGYTVGDTLTILFGNNNGTVTVTQVDGSTGAVQKVEGNNTGTGYVVGTYSTSGGTGIGATIAISVNTTGFLDTTFQTGTFQTKPDNVIACIRMPSKTGQILIMGSTVTEVWSDLAYQSKFPYQRTTGYNIDYGCLNPATIAANDDFVVWLGSNEHSGPVIMYCTGGSVNQISNDGINYRLENIKNPQNSYGFIFKQDGHVFYQLTFASKNDNVTYTYDFNTKKFYTLCDENQNCHIAKRVAYYKNDYYFVSFSDGYLYQIDSNFTTYNGKEIPRIIITSPSALPDRKPFLVNSVTFPLEQGNMQDLGRIDMCTSSDGAVTFGNSVGIDLNPTGKRRNIFKFYNLGRYNEISFQFRFWGLGRFVLTDGVAEVV